MKKTIVLIYFLSMTSYIAADSKVSHHHLFEIARTGTIKEMQAYKDQNEDLGITDEHGNTLLHCAAMHGRTDIIEVLTKPKESPSWYKWPAYIVYHWWVEKALPAINAQNKDGETPLHCAIKHGQEDAVNLLLSKKVDVKRANKDGLTPLLAAIESGQFAIFNRLIAEGQSVLDHSIQGKNALSFAIQQKQLAFVTLLSHHPKLRDSLDVHGLAAIHYCGNDNKESLELLLKNGADINQKDKWGKTILNYAYSNNDPEHVAFLRRHNANPDTKDHKGETELHRATAQGDSAKVTLLIKDGLNLNEQNNNGETPTHIAIQNNNKPLIDIFIANNADMNKRTHNGLTPFALALEHGHISVAKKLEKKSDINTQDSKGQSALLRAAWRNDLGSIDYLRSIGADSILVDNEKNSIVHAVAHTGNDDLMRSLLSTRQLSALVNAANNNGITPLHNAAYTNKSMAIDVLIQHGAQIRVKNKWGKTPVHCAAEKGYKDSLVIFKQYDDKSLTDLDQEGNSPLHLVMFFNHMHCIPSLMHRDIINSKTNQGYTPLHLGIIKDVPYVGLDELIRAGADPSITDNEGRNCLHLAIAYKRNVACHNFATSARLINQTDNKGIAPIHRAVDLGDAHVVKTLLNNRSLNIDMQDRDGMTAIARAARYGHLTIMDDLIAHRAHLDLKDSRGFTPMAHASFNGNIEGVKRLARAGALINTCDINGNNNMLIAASQGHSDVFDYFRAQGFSLDARNNHGETSFMMAGANGHTEFAKKIYQNRDESDVAKIILHARRNGHYGTVRFLESIIKQRDDECNALYNQQAAIQDLVKQNKNDSYALAQQAHGEYTSLMYAYKSSGYRHEISKSEITSWNPAQRAQLKAQLDSHYYRESEENRTLKDRLKKIGQKKELIKKECQALYNEQSSLCNLIEQNKNDSALLKQQAVKEYASFSYAYKPSGYNCTHREPLEKMLSWSPEQRLNFKATLDVYHEEEAKQNSRLKNGLTSIVQKKEEKQHMEKECSRLINTQDVVYSLIDHNKKHAAELNALQAPISVPGYDPYTYKSSNCAFNTPYSKDMIMKLDEQGRKSYTRTLLMCQNHETQEKTRIDQRLNTVRQLANEQLRQKQEASETLKTGQQQPIAAPKAPAFPVPHNQQMQQPHIPAANNLPQENDLTCYDCAYAQGEVDDQGRRVELHRIPCSNCKKGSSRICNACMEKYNVKSGSVKCPFNCPQPMNDFSVFEEKKPAAQQPFGK